MSETTSLTLAEFLRARLAEDEQWARDPECSQDPHRLLAECDAKRRILDRLERLAEHLDAADGMMYDEYSARLVDGIGVDMARPYANHPDWREEWRPVA